MQRQIDYSMNVFIEKAFELLPTSLSLHLSRIHILHGVSPKWVGLHNYVDKDSQYALNKSAHYVSIRHQFILPKHLRHPTIVLPNWTDCKIVLHELGHYVDEELSGRTVDVEPITEYALKNRREAFAEAFSYCYMSKYNSEWEQAYNIRRMTLDNFRIRIEDIIHD